MNPNPLALRNWEKAVELNVVMPLDARAISMFGLFQVIYGITGNMYGYYRREIDNTPDMEHFIECFKGLMR